MRPKNKTVIIATRNQGKVKEFADMFSSLNIEVKSVAQFAGLPDIIEDGQTFAANALKKAKTIAELLQLPVIADDSGLCVDALGGKPGVYSARFAGEHASDKQNNEKLLAELSGCQVTLEGPETAGENLLSKAQFKCALVLYDPARSSALHAEGVCAGYILSAPRGVSGFGYDPLFYLPQFGRTMAELSMEEKNRISHRGLALKQLLSMLG